MNESKQVKADRIFRSSGSKQFYPKVLAAGEGALKLQVNFMDDKWET